MLKLLDIFFPKVCGVCKKICNEYICKKCEIKLQKYEYFQKNLRSSKNSYDELISPFFYSKQIRKLILEYKFKEQIYLYKTISKILINNQKTVEKISKYDTIIAVPISNKRFKERGYNQTYLIAKEIACILQKDIVNDVIIKSKNTLPQSTMNIEQRQKNIIGAYETRENENASKYVTNKNVLIIDDVYTTGSTVNEVCKTLSKLHPKYMGVLAISKD